MGPPESGLLSKRDAQRNTTEEKDPFPNRQRQRFPRPRGFPRKLHYIQWICTVVLFFFFMVLFQILLPGSTVELHDAAAVSQNRLIGLEDRLELDLREQPGFDRPEFLARLNDRRGGGRANRTGARFGSRKPHLAMVFPDLTVDSLKILMVTLACSLKDIGYEIQVYSLEDGPVRDVWTSVGVAVTVLQTSHHHHRFHVDWSNYDGVLVNSICSSNLYSEFMVEPFKDVPLIWTIHNAVIQDGSKEFFRRSNVVVFPSYELMRIYSGFDTGNFYPVLGSPAEECGGGGRLLPSSGGFVIAIVRSQLVYRGFWLELALVLEALKPVVSFTRIAVVSGYSSGNHSKAVRAIARNLGFADDVVEHYGDAGDVLSISDVVIYASFVDEIVFPHLLVRAMCLGKVVVAPDLPIIRKYVTDYLFPKDDVRALRQIFMRIESNRNSNRNSSSSTTVKNANVLEAVQGYGLLLEHVVRFPSEVFLPRKNGSSSELQWRWDLFEQFTDSAKMRRGSSITITSSDSGLERKNDGVSSDFDYRLWEEEEKNEIERRRRSIEEDELKDRSDQPHGTWEEVYRNAKRADRLKNDLHERDDGELERTGQTICIYEPYYGEGVWPFLHRSPLYRGIGLSTRGRRREEDDVDAPSRLPILNNSYYRDALGEYGAFFAIANRVDRLHKNPWIGFQSWRATARNASLSESAAEKLIHAIESREHGDAFYFWIRMDEDRRYSPEQDFWSFCDAINSGNCRFAFIGAMKKMYGITWDFRVLPPMKSGSDTRFGSWSVMHSWALPTRSFLELVMFSRMFVDALDSQFRDHPYCYLSMYKDKQCYSRVLELLVNVWAYHSARRMVYVDPMTGSMEEHHGLSSRRGHMWVKWFTYPTLKAMDEDLAEEWDLERPTSPWLWPSTGEVIWQGLYDRERTHRQMEKEKRRQRSKEKISRMRGRSHQKAIGKYVKPTGVDDTIDEFNSTQAHR